MAIILSKPFRLVISSIKNFNVINSVCPIIDQEFIRVLETNSGMWKPGLNNLEVVDMEKEVSMMFVANQQNLSNP